MLIKNLKTIQETDLAAPVNISTILDEVKRHGFYSNYCINLRKGIGNIDELVSEIRKIASKNLLRVTFNADRTICIFED